MMSRFVGQEIEMRWGIGGWKPGSLCSLAVSARSLWDLAVPGDQSHWIPTIGHPESVREGIQGPGAEVQKRGQRRNTAELSLG